MLLASYKATRPGLQGIVNRVIRWRFNGVHSHSEIVFEPGDGVDDLMPDGTCAADAAGALWCVSAVAWEVLPAHSSYRPGKRGGVRFKRIVLDPHKWDLRPLPGHSALEAARLARRHEGEPYSWRLIARWVAWYIERATQTRQWACSTFCALLLGLREPDRYDPCLLDCVALDGADVLHALAPMETAHA
mgnify:CR=1 FL=1